MPTSHPPHIAAPARPTDYSERFKRLATDIILLAWKVRARFRLWNYWSDGGHWSLSLLPGIHLSKGLDESNFKYRLGIGWGPWFVDVGLCPPKRVLIHDGKNFVRTDNLVTGERTVVDVPPLTEVYDPDEANERP